MPIAICGKCGKPCQDSYHDFKKVCQCVYKNKKVQKAHEKLAKYINKKKVNMSKYMKRMGV